MLGGMPRPFDAWSPRAKALARPFAENPFRLLELEPGASAAEVARAVKRLQSGRAPVRMLATGPSTRSAEQIQQAAALLAEPDRAGRHTLFLPWLRRLTIDAEALPAALEALTATLLRAVKPVELAASLADWALPARSVDDDSEDEDRTGAERIAGGRFFPADLDVAALLGPPTPEPEPAGARAGILDALGKAPAALADAVLAATRLGQGRQLHLSYLRTLLAQADGGDRSALRRLAQAGELFEEIAGEPGAPLLLGYRNFLEGKPSAAKKVLARAVKDGALGEADDVRARVLLARMAGNGSALEGLEGPEAAAARTVVLLAQGAREEAAAALEHAWQRAEQRPRLAPLRALLLLVGDDPDGAAAVLDAHGPGHAALERFTRAWTAHAQGDFERALELYDETLALQPAHRGALWGRAALCANPVERAQARAGLSPHAADDPALAAGLLELALDDGALDELPALLDALDEGELELRVEALDHLGRRAEAWALRGVDESAVRDAARALLERGDARGALRELAGLSLADPLRRRAARQAVLEALEADAGAHPDAVVERVLGRVGQEELALLDLPAHLYRGVRELQEGNAARAIVSLRRHLDSADDPVAARLFDVLTAPAGQGIAALGALLGEILEVDPRDLEALVDEAIDADDALFEAAVIVAALQGGAFEVGELDGGSAALQQATALLELRRGLLHADWNPCADALAQAARAVPAPLPELQRAQDALALARFPEAVFSDPLLALQALRVAQDDPAARLHDLAVWRHLLAVEAEHTLSASELREVVSAWCAARDGQALGHPALPEEATLLEDELLTQLAALLETVSPDRAEAARAALVGLKHPFAEALLARAGWAPPAPTRRKKA